MIRLTNYLTLQQPAKISLIEKLQEMRDEVAKLSRMRKVPKTRKPRKRKMVFFSDAIEKLFNSMDEDAKKFIMEGK